MKITKDEKEIVKAKPKVEPKAKTVIKNESATDAENRASLEAAKQPKPKGAHNSLTNNAIGEVNPEVTEAEQAETDKTLFGRIAKSGLVFVRDHTNGTEYVGIPPSQDPDATDASKRLSAVFSLAQQGPRTGMQVRPKDGDPFTVADGFGQDANPDRWEGVVNPATGKGLFSA